MRSGRGLTVAALLVLAGVRPSAQGQPFRDRRPFKSGVEVTSITATVTDKDGHLVAGLDRGVFEIFEDGERQAVTQFTRQRVPISVSVLLDISDSMYGQRVKDARAAVEHFLFDLLDPKDDEYSIVAFNHQAHVLTGWTDTPQVVRRALDSLRPSGGTAVYDAVLQALPLVAHRRRQRAALLIISDGADTASTASLRDVRSALFRSDVFAYAIAIDPPDTRAINGRVNLEALQTLTGETGGRVEVVRTTADLVTATARIAEELNSQYVLGYISPRGADGQFHSIRVRVSGSDYRVRARNGYVAVPLAPGSP